MIDRTNYSLTFHLLVETAEHSGSPTEDISYGPCCKPRRARSADGMSEPMSSQIRSPALPTSEHVLPQSIGNCE
jgi:hypothetical protein